MHGNPAADALLGKVQTYCDNRKNDSGQADYLSQGNSQYLLLCL
jgi:hypothetical protein